MINDIIYDSIKEASERLNISEQIIAKRLNSKEPIPVTSKKRINIDGNIYDSITEASRKLNININTIVRRLRNNNFKNYTYLPIEYIDLSKYKYV
jgi:Zn-dependent peptidase ImmA (M78 family)